MTALCCFLCFALTACLLCFFVSGNGSSSNSESSVDYGINDRFDRYITNSISDALDGILAIEKVYWLSDNDLVAPEPNPDCYGSTADPVALQAVIDNARGILDGQELIFQSNTQLYPGTEAQYYSDPTIFAVTWKQRINQCVYVISEIKIEDPSQFRRFLSDGEFASGSKYLTTQMATSVNAVVAANGDYYAMRQMGTIVYNSQVLRDDGHYMDTCFIDGNGDLVFFRADEMTDSKQIRQFVADNQVRFSVAFGPVLVEDGKACAMPTRYPVGEMNQPNARAALCQVDPLHYLLVVASIQPPYDAGVKLSEFAATLEDMGVKKAYNLDGGRSATLSMDNKLINYVYERLVSDIIYFATAIPDGK